MVLVNIEYSLNDLIFLTVEHSFIIQLNIFFLFTLYYKVLDKQNNLM